MNKKRKKDKIKHKKEVKKLKKKYISGSSLAIFVMCQECKYRNGCSKKDNQRDITACSEGVIDLNIIREMLKNRKI